jgi:hypothetical protein
MVEVFGVKWMISSFFSHRNFFLSGVSISETSKREEVQVRNPLNLPALGSGSTEWTRYPRNAAY